MKAAVIGTRYLSFSPISILTDACAASSGVPIRTIKPPAARKFAAFRAPALAHGYLRPAFDCRFACGCFERSSGDTFFTRKVSSDKMNNRDDEYRGLRLWSR